jgi:DNA-binding protein YbaB
MGARILDPNVLDAEIERAVSGYVTGLADEQVTGTAGGVQVRMRLDGELAGLEIDPDVPARYGTARLGDLVVQAVQAAVRAATDRRAELARAVTFLDQPVLELVQEMIDDPAGTVSRLTARDY